MDEKNTFIFGYLKHIPDKGKDVALCPPCMDRGYTFNPNLDVIFRAGDIVDYLEGLACEACGELIFFPSVKGQDDRLSVFETFIDTLDMTDI